MKTFQPSKRHKKGKILDEDQTPQAQYPAYKCIMEEQWGTMV